MRYWIYWNDLVQGPFEPGELASLKAFTTDLPVCEEEGQDWIPAAAVPDLLPYFQVVVKPYIPVSAPPPPPPAQPPRIVPLQGEFFSEAAGQQTLFDQNGSKNYLFRAVQSDLEKGPEISLPPLSTPFRFIYRSAGTAPIPSVPSSPRLPPSVPAPEPAYREEVELGILEPEETIVHELPIAPPVPAPKPIPSPVAPPPALEIPAPLDEVAPIIRPVPTRRPPMPQPVFRPTPIAIPDFSPTQRPSLDEEIAESKTTRLWPWLVGVGLAFALGGLGVYGWRVKHHPVVAMPSVETPLVSVPPIAEPVIPNVPIPPPPAVPVPTWQTVSWTGLKNPKKVTPAGVMLDSHGQVWVADPVNNQLQAAAISDVSGTMQTANWDVKGQLGATPGQFHAPIGLATDAQGHVWVADKGNNCIQMYDPAVAKWVAFGQAGTASGEFNAPAAVAVDAQNHVWVADKVNHRLQMFDPTTQQWTSIGQQGTDVGQFNNPSGVAVDAQGVVWVADQGNHRVQSYNPVTSQWTTYGQKGKALGSFNAPTAVAVDAHGRVWVAEQGNHRVQVYNPHNERWLTIGKLGHKAGEFNAPAGIAFDPQGHVWVADRGNRRLQVARVLTSAPLAAGKRVKTKAGVVASPPVSIPVPAVASPTEAILDSMEEKPEAKVQSMPGVAAPTPEPVPVATPSPTPTAAKPSPGREQEAIALTLKQKIYDGKRTIGENAKLMLDAMHEKELLHAADTGERLHMPDKITWSALLEQGSQYRVYLNFLAWQANGERTMVRSDQFAVDLDKKTVVPLDDSTRHDFYDIAAMLQHQHNLKADDIENVLEGVDALNRHKLRAVILKASKKKDEQKKMKAELQAAEDKLQRQIVYFRTKYAEKTLQNIAKAFDFVSTMKGK